MALTCKSDIPEGWHCPVPTTLSDHWRSFQVSLSVSTLCPKNKLSHLMFDNIFGKCEPIFTILSPGDFEWRWVILTDLAKYSTTRSVARSLCDSWATYLVRSRSDKVKLLEIIKYTDRPIHMLLRDTTVGVLY